MPFHLAGVGARGKRLEEAEARSCAVGKIWRQDDDDGARPAVFFSLSPGRGKNGKDRGWEERLGKTDTYFFLQISS